MDPDFVSRPILAFLLGYVENRCCLSTSFFICGTRNLTDTDSNLIFLTCILIKALISIRHAQNRDANVRSCKRFVHCKSRL